MREAAPPDQRGHGLGWISMLDSPQLPNCGPQEPTSTAILAFPVMSACVPSSQALLSEARSLEPDRHYK